MLGLSNKDISRRMTITDGTVKTHIKAIFGKLDARNRTEAVAIARRRGLLLETVMPERIENGRTTAFHILRQA
jgi:ATP/maltotriose-dependent transcriptional regulator MalT